MPFRALGLRAELVRAVSEEGYDRPTPVQVQAIPVVLEGRDLMAGAQTGTGKTAAFTLPLLQILAETPSPEPPPRHSKPYEDPRPGARRRGRPAPRPVRALILAPTRELAIQVAESVNTYGRYLPLRSAVVYGGVGIVPQIEALRRGVDVLVATPGRLLDLMGRRSVDLSGIEILVLDEADRMLDMGFIKDIRRILGVLPRKRQNLLFSATFPDAIKALAKDLLHDPESIQVERRNAPPDLVSQVVYPVDGARKRQALAHLIGTNRWNRVLVFTRTKRGANRLAQQLEDDGITASAIHGNKSQGARTKALHDFKKGAVRVLVATDIAARGLDIDQLPHVVNYELPHVPEDYVHRIGRTGRAGNEGAAVSLVAADERGLLGGIERLLNREIPVAALEGFVPVLTARRPGSDNRRPGPGGRRPGSDNRRPGSDKRRGGPDDRRAASDSWRSAPDDRRSGASRPGRAKAVPAPAAPAHNRSGRAPGDAVRNPDRPHRKDVVKPAPGRPEFGRPRRKPSRPRP